MSEFNLELDKAIDDLTLFDDDFGKLAHDFNCKKADNIYFKPLADGVRHFKETEKGRDAMCESFTKLADKVAEERAIIAKQLQK